MEIRVEERRKVSCSTLFYGESAAKFRGYFKIFCATRGSDVQLRRCDSQAIEHSAKPQNDNSLGEVVVEASREPIAISVGPVAADSVAVLAPL